MDAKELQAAQENLKKKSDAKKKVSSKAADLLTMGKRIGTKPVKHKMDGFEFETITVMPDKVRDKFISVATRVESGATTIEDIIDAAAELMSKICIDEELQKPEVWKEFNESSGALITIVHHMLKELVVSQEEIETFR